MDLAQVLEESGLGRKLSCSLQDARPGVPTAKPLPRNALGRKLSCSLQDSASGACGLVGAGLADCARRIQGGTADTGGNNRDCVCAISLDCPGRPAGTRRRCGAGDGDIPGGAASGNPVDCTQASADDSGKAERLAGSSDNGDHSSDGSKSGCEPSIVKAPLRQSVCRVAIKSGSGVE